MTETVLLDSPTVQSNLYFQMDYSDVVKVVVEYVNTIGATSHTFTYEGEPTGAHLSDERYVQILFGRVGVSDALVISSMMPNYAIRFERVTVYEGRSPSGS